MRRRSILATALLGWVLAAQPVSAQEPINGVCDDSARNSCAAGRANDDAFPDHPTVYVWRCDGLNGGTNSEKCIKFVPVDGACDESARNSCAAGTANDDAFPDHPTVYVWRCDGLHGGRTPKNASNTCRWMASATTAHAIAARPAGPTTTLSPTTRRSTCGAAMGCTAARTPRSASNTFQWMARATTPCATAALPAPPTTTRSRTMARRISGAATASTVALTRSDAP